MITVAGFTIGGPDEPTATLKLYPMPSRFTDEGVLLPTVPYGWGTTPDTQAFLDQLARLDLKGKSVADIGSGTGLLAIAAAQAGAIVTAYESDPVSADLTQRNADLNGVALTLKGRFPDEWDGKPYDYAFANLGQSVPESDVAATIFVTDEADRGITVLTPELTDERPVLAEAVEEVSKAPVSLEHAKELRVDLHQKSMAEQRAYWQAIPDLAGPAQAVTHAAIHAAFAPGTTISGVEPDPAHIELAVVDGDIGPLLAMIDPILEADPEKAAIDLFEWITIVRRHRDKAHAILADHPEDEGALALLVARLNEGKLNKHAYLRNVNNNGIAAHWSDITINLLTLPCGCQHEHWFTDSEGDLKSIRHHRAVKQCAAHPGNGKAAWITAHRQLDVLGEVQRAHPGAIAALTLAKGKSVMAIKVSANERGQAQAHAHVLFGDQDFYTIS